MRKILHKVKSQWVVLGVMGATVVSLGTANVPKVSASEVDGQADSEMFMQSDSAEAVSESITFITEEMIAEEVPYTTKEIFDGDLEAGKVEVRQEGVNGSQKNTYTVSYTDGVETSRTLSSTIVTIAPTEKIIAIGTKDATAPTIDILSLSTSVKLVSDGETIRISLGITDNIGVSSAEITYISPSTGQTKSITLYKNETNGYFEGTVTVNAETEAGNWIAKTITAYDISGNASQFNNVVNDLSAADFTVDSSTPRLVASETNELYSAEIKTDSVDSEIARETAAPLVMMQVIEDPQTLSLQAEQPVNLATNAVLSASTDFVRADKITDMHSNDTNAYADGAPGLQWVQLDLGAAYDLEAVKLWHYYGDGRSYRDVIVQLSNEASFGSGTVTVFNNDADGSAGLGVGTDGEYNETSDGKTIAFAAVNARYARFYTNGSNVNSSNHYVEIEVYGAEAQTPSKINLAPEGTLSSSVSFDRIALATDKQSDNSGAYADGASGLQWVQVDLGSASDLNEIKLWHYYADGRSYHDVIVQLSNDANFANGILTVFNNDADGSAGLGAGTDSEYNETSAGKTIAFATVNARYARFYSNGSNVNGSNHYVEIEVYGSELQVAPEVNLAPEGTLSSSVNFDRIALATDKQSDNSGAYADGASGLQWVQVDLGDAHDLNAVKLWHYYADGRSYQDVVVQLSNDANFVSNTVTVFNNDTDGSAGLGVGTDSEYSETSAGKTIAFNTVNARYARFYSNGSNVNGSNHYVEIEVYGNESTKTESKTEAVIDNVVRYTTIELLDDKLLTGETQLIQTGLDGYDTITYEVIYTNGVETSRSEIGRETTDVVNEIIRKGTKVVETKTETATENKVAFTIVEQEDNTIPTGERKIVQKGSNGYDTVSYAVTYTNGVETNRLETSRQTIQAVDEIVKVGTQVIETKSEIATENVVNSKTIEILDSTLSIGERKTIQSGRNGYDKVTYEVTYTNGSETSRTEMNRKTITVLNEVVVVGTQVVETKNQVVTENEVVYKIVEQSDDTLQLGKREVIQTGSNGFDKVTYAITYTNGVETGRIKLASVTTASVNEVVKVGTKVVEKKVETVEVTNGTAPEIIEITDSTLLAGERIVIQKGESGYDLITYEVIYTNGAETGRTEVNRETIASVTEFVKVGTKIVGTKTETVTENIVGYTTTVQDDDTLPTGETEYALVGANGYDTVTYEVTYINGVAASRKEISRVTTSPVNETIRVGTQVIENKTETATENESAFTTIELEDDTIPAGTRVILQAGTNGYDVVTYDVTYTNGAPTNYLELSRETIASVSEIVKVGTQIIEMKNEIKNENIIGYTTLVEEDATLSANESIVYQTGANGFDAVTYEVTYTNGVETSRVEVSRQTTAPMNQIVKVGTKISVTNITVTSEDADSIILNGSTLQMAASILPGDATAAEVTWSVEAGTGSATIDSAGLLTAMSAGTVTVKATANDGSGVVGNKVIEIAVPVAIVGYNGSNLDVVIPELIDGSLEDIFRDFSFGLEYGKKGIVTSINDHAFSYKQLTSVEIPDSVISIGNGAFFDNQLSNIAIPNGVTYIGDFAFGINQLTDVIIPEGVTAIGSYAFSNNRLMNIAIPETVTSIGDNVFANNQLVSVSLPEGLLKIENYAFASNQLLEIELPKSVTTIGDNAFFNNQLLSVTIPEGVTSIGNYAFGVNQLTTVTIPSAVTKIGEYAFTHNRLTSVVIPDGVTSIAQYAFSENQLNNVVIPESVTSIGVSAFSNNLLASLTIPKGVTSIGMYAFSGNQLTSVSIPISVKTIGIGAFVNNRLTSVDIPEGVTNIGEHAFNSNQLMDVVIPKTVKIIGDYAFYANQLKTVIVPTGVTRIEDNAFGVNQITKVVLPDSVTSIGNSAFRGNQLTSLSIPKSVTIIGTEAFSYNQLTNIIIPNSVKVIGSSAFMGNQISIITLGAGVQFGENVLTDDNKFREVYKIGGAGTYILTQDGEWIKVEATRGNETTTENRVDYVTIIEEDLSLAADETKIYQAGIAGYDTVTYEVIYNNGTEISRVEVSRQTTSPLKQIIKVGKKIEVNNISVTSAEDKSLILNGTTLQMSAVVLPEDANIMSVIWSVENGTGSATIDSNGLLAATSAGTVTVKATSNDGSAVVGSKVIEIAVPLTVIKYSGSNLDVLIPEVFDGNKVESKTEYISGYGYITYYNYNDFGLLGGLDYDKKGIVTYIGGNSFSSKQLTSVVIPDSVISIGENSFSWNKLTSIDIPIAVTNIGEAAFYGNQLTNVNIPASLKNIGVNVFGSNHLTNIDIPKSVVSIGGGAFYDNQLTSIAIPDTITNIGASAFSGNLLTSVTIPDSIISIEINAFSDNQLTSVTIPDSITNIGEGAFSGNKLMNVVIPTSVVSIGKSAFRNNQLLSVVIPEGVTTIGEYAFYNNQLMNVEIPEGVISIGSFAFSSNYSYWDDTNGYGNQLTNVIIPPSVTNIGDYAFYGNKLTSLVIPEGVISIGSYAFYNNQLTSLVIPASVTSIGDSAFEYNGLTSVVIPAGVTSIGNRAFYGNQLPNVDIPTSVTSIGSWAFYNNRLTNVTIPEGVTTIGEYAFYANQLTSVAIPDSVTTIGNNAFESNKLTSVEISKGVTSIGTQEFNNNQLTSVVIPDGVISIGNNAFSNNQLSSVDIPNTVSIIGTSAFYNNQLTEIVIPDSLTTIGSYAFQGNQLTSVVIPEGVTFIGNGAFSQNLFTSITIGEGVQVGDSLLGTNNNFRSAYTTGGAGTYTGTQDGDWIKVS